MRELLRLDGRLGRGAFLLRVGVLALLGFFLSSITLTISAAMLAPQGWALTAAAAAPPALLAIPAGVRRLRDRGRPPWLLAAFWPGAAALAWAGLALADSEPEAAEALAALALMLAGAALWLWGAVEMAALPGRAVASPPPERSPTIRRERRPR